MFVDDKVAVCESFLTLSGSAAIIYCQTDRVSPNLTPRIVIVKL